MLTSSDRNVDATIHLTDKTIDLRCIHCGDTISGLTDWDAVDVWVVDHRDCIDEKLRAETNDESSY